MELHMSEKKETKVTENKDFSYKVIEECGTLSVNKTRAGENEKKLRYMSWNGREPKYDIRKWYIGSDGEEHCLKPEGTFTGEELMKLLDILKILNGEKEAEK